MKEVAAFLQHCKPFYLATMDGDKPQVRPFGALCEFEDKLYLITTNKKAVYRQMKQNPNVAICGMYEDKWIRISGQVEEDTRREARVAMMETNKEVLSKMYSVDDQLKRFLSVWTNRSGAATGETLNSIKAVFVTGLSTKNARPASFTTARLAKPMDIGCL